MASRLSKAAETISKFFDALQNPVLRQRDVIAILDENRDGWRLPQNTHYTDLVKLLSTKGKLRRIVLAFPYKPETLFVWGKVSPMAVAVAAKPQAYLCHHTAMDLHQLTEGKSRVIYANWEQPPQAPSDGPLLQHGIDLAFRRRQRITKYRASFDKYTLCVINGKKTNALGVTSMNDPDGRPLRVTGIERALIDITVRPAYAGGPARILEAFRRGRGRFSVPDLAAMLTRMEFVYPYHQAIGFYLERSGYGEKDLASFRKLPQTHDFYLDYAMKSPAYSTNWRLHHPADLR
jgi:predicted transcriptional regulator of viral defense system